MENLRFNQFSDSSFPLHVIHNQEHFDYPLHRHDFCELVLVLDGTGVHHTETVEHEIQKGDVFVITQEMCHGYRDVRDFEIISTLFCPEALGIPNWDLKQISGFHTLYHLEPKLRASQCFRSYLHLSNRHLAHARHQALLLKAELDGELPGYMACAAAMLTELFVYVSRSVAEQSQGATQTIHKFGELLSYLETNYHCADDLEAMAKRVHMSKRNFQRQFKEATNTSPIQYLLELRISKAQQLLRRTDQSITDIAFNTGFHDSNYFTRQFKRATGMAPLQFCKSRN